MARSTCGSCKAPLRKRGARCGVCGWADEYDPWTKRQERERFLGVLVAIILVVAFAIVIAFARPLLLQAPAQSGEAPPGGDFFDRNLTTPVV